MQWDSLYFILYHKVCVFMVTVKYLQSFEVQYWRRMEKINWTDRVRNEEV